MIKSVVVFFMGLSALVATAEEPANLAAFREARFGMFIHFGLYSLLGGSWRGRRTDRAFGEWIQNHMRIPGAEYAQLAKVFNPQEFDPDDWAKRAKDAGMEYVVLTAKHHEGFALFATEASEFDVMDATPFKHDIVGEFAAACRRHGLKVGLYYSQFLDWHEPDGGDPTKPGIDPSAKRAIREDGTGRGNTWDFPDAVNKDFERYFRAKAYPQIRELLTNYGDIFLIWFDTPSGMSPEQSRGFREYVREISPQTIVSGRIGHGYGDFCTMGDNELVTNRSDVARESAMTLNNTWGFRYDDHNWKSPYTVATILAQNLSHGANVLLNVGPRPEGRFPDAACDILAELGTWRRRTGFAIHGVKASPFKDDFPWGWCMIAPGNVLQLVIREEWTRDIVLEGVANRVTACTSPYEQTGGRIVIKPSQEPDLMPRVIRVTLDGAPEVRDVLVIFAHNDVSQTQK